MPPPVTPRLVVRPTAPLSGQTHALPDQKSASRILSGDFSDVFVSRSKPSETRLPPSGVF